MRRRLRGTRAPAASPSWRLAVVLVAGCERRAQQDAPAADAPAATLVATADYGARDAARHAASRPDQSVMRATRGATEVRTAYAGGFVQGMLGLDERPRRARATGSSSSTASCRRWARRRCALARRGRGLVGLPRLGRPDRDAGGGRRRGPRRSALPGRPRARGGGRPAARRAARAPPAPGSSTGDPRLAGARGRQRRHSPGATRPGAAPSPTRTRAGLTVDDRGRARSSRSAPTGGPRSPSPGARALVAAVPDRDARPRTAC